MTTITKSSIGAGVSAAAAVGTAQCVAVYTAAVATANAAGILWRSDFRCALAIGSGSLFFG